MSEKTVAVVEEIKALLKKHDLTGMIRVQDRSSNTFLHHIEASWSCAHFEEIPGETDGAVAIRFRAKAVDFESKEAHQKMVQDTLGMFMAFANQAERDQEQMMQVVTMLAKHFPDIRYWEKFQQDDGDGDGENE